MECVTLVLNSCVCRISLGTGNERREETYFTYGNFLIKRLKIPL